MSEHEILQRIFFLMRTEILLCRNGKNNAPRPIKNTSKKACYNVLAEIQDLLGTNCYYIVPPKMTNADRIRSMNAEELARILYDVSWAAWRTINGEGIWTEQDWLDWLKQEADE